MKEFLIKDNNNLDFIRIICASLVIVGHYYVISPVPGETDLIKLLTGFTYSGAVAVKIFFFISGMLVTDSLLRKQSVKSFIVSRFFRMMPALFFVLFITAFIYGPAISKLPAKQYFANRQTYEYFFYNSVFFTKYLLPGVFSENFFPHLVNGSLWSLRLEVRCYVFLLLVFILIKKRILAFNLVIALVFIDAFFKWHIIGRGVSNEHSLLPMSFALGAFLAVNKERIKVNYKVVLVCILFTAVFWRSAVNEILFIITVCFSVIVLAENKYIRKIKIKNDISYGIYLWGFLIQQSIVYFLGQLNIYFFMSLSILLAVIMGYLSFIIVEKRGMNWGRIFDKKTDSYFTKNKPVAELIGK